jgi:hypothetical protein
MAQQRWRLRGTDVEFCSCDPGCGCNFRGFPSSKEGNCEAFVVAVIEDGQYGDVDLSGCKVAWALWWPAAIHDGDGYGHAYMDCRTDEQFEVLSRIWRGEEGYSFFEIFNSTFKQPSAVDRTTIDLELKGKDTRFSVKGVGEAVMTTLRNPVTGAENNVTITKPDGFIWKEAAIAQSERLWVKLPEMSFEHSGRHALVGPFEWSSA